MDLWLPNHGYGLMAMDWSNALRFFHKGFAYNIGPNPFPVKDHIFKHKMALL